MEKVKQTEGTERKTKIVATIILVKHEQKYRKCLPFCLTNFNAVNAAVNNNTTLHITDIQILFLYEKKENVEENSS